MFEDLIKKKTKIILGRIKTVAEENDEKIKQLEEIKKVKDYIFGKEK